jgi:hypothetical protein
MISVAPSTWPGLDRFDKLRTFARDSDTSENKDATGMGYSYLQCIKAHIARLISRCRIWHLSFEFEGRGKRQLDSERNEV